MRWFICFCVVSIACLTTAHAADVKESAGKLPLLAEEDFEHGAKDWEHLDPKSWKLVEQDGNHVLSQHVKAGSYEPPHRSPYHVALWNAKVVSDFELTARVHSTHEDYGHRDACLFFGYQDPAHFYYVHLGKEMDPHANQIFIVNGKDRTKISNKTTDGTPWDDEWHTVRIVRDVESGDIKVFWDDVKEPVMTAVDKNFTWGRVGVGSFDDTADWDDLKLRGIVPKIPADRVDGPSQVEKRF